MSDGRHRRIRPRLRLLAAGAVVLLGLTLAAAGWRVRQLGGECPGGRTTVAAAPEIAPVIANLGVPCLRAEPVAPGVRPAADLWIPASGAWLALLGTDNAYTVEGSTALSPLVVVMPRAAAVQLGWPAVQPGWRELSGAHRLSMADPAGTTEGLLSVLAVQSAMDRTQRDPGIAQLAALTVRSKLASATAETHTMFTAGVAVFPATEQQYWTHRAANPGTQLAAVYPPDGPIEADYPLLVSRRAGTDPARAAKARALLEAFRAPKAARPLADRGLRSVSEPGMFPEYPASAGLLPPEQRTAALVAQWTRYKPLKFQVLLLVDASWSMNDRIVDRGGSANTKAGLLRMAGAQATKLFGEETSLGMWTFASPPSARQPYAEVVPFGPISTRRELLGNAAARYQPIPNAGTPLYETVLRGVAHMQPKVAQGTMTLVVVLTDGRDEDSPYAMSQQQYLTKLAALADPRRPVPVFSIGYGAGADMTVLTETAHRTGGQAIPSADPGDLAEAMARVFLAAHTS
ncbi:vWA domain-containing protein [Longispora albida]|uniref:vWA domain-containing protein n=1 Tax=Longispora albida TaxID=203523 RepID=UPI000378C05E|nr:substrate-binding domain-containing protein [Longispora albida]